MGCVCGRWDAAALPAWLESARPRVLESDVLRPVSRGSIADRVEGNLLAAKQELDMLALLAERPRPSMPNLWSCVPIGDSARYDVLQLGRGRGRGRCVRGHCGCSRGCATRVRNPPWCYGRCCASCADMYQARERAAHWDRTVQPKRLESGGSSPSQSAQRRDCASSRWRASVCSAGIAHGPDHQGPHAVGDAWSSLVTADSRRSSPALCKAPRDSGRVARMNPMGIFGGTFDPDPLRPSAYGVRAAAGAAA